MAENMSRMLKAKTKEVPSTFVMDSTRENAHKNCRETTKERFGLAQLIKPIQGPKNSPNSCKLGNLPMACKPGH